MLSDPNHNNILITIILRMFHISSDKILHDYKLFKELRSTEVFTKARMISDFSANYLSMDFSWMGEIRFLKSSFFCFECDIIVLVIGDLVYKIW